MNNADEQAGQDIPLPNTEYDLRKQAAELIIANKELAFQNEEKEKRAAELIIANKELAFQNEEKEKRAAELIIAQELALQAAEKYRIVADFTYDWEIWQDPGGALRYVSPSCERITGYKAAEFIADPGLILQITHPDDQAKVREHLHEDQEKESMELDFRIITLDGGIRWIDHVCTGVYNKDGQFLGRRASNRDVTGRKRLEEELQQISTRLSMAVRAGGVGIWDYDVSHNTLIWDDQMFRLYGITSAQFSGAYEAWMAEVHPEDQERCENEKRMALRGEKEYDTEFRVLWPDGSTHYIRAMASVQRNAASQGVRMVGMNWDITGHRLAEAMLEKSRLRLENIIEATHIGTWEWNVQTGETVFNEAWAEIIGYTLDELAPVSIKTWEKLAHPDDMKQSMLLLERHFAGELPYYDYECRMKHRNGHWVWVHDRGRVVTRTADGKPLLMFGNHTELIKSNAYLENLINCANAPIIVWDSQFHITRFNHAFELLTGRSEAEVLGQSLDILFPPALVQETTAMISRTVAGERWEAVEIEIMHRNGTTRTVLWNSATLFAPDDKTPIATIAQGQDITASKLMKKALIESEARYKLIAENAFDLIALVDSNGRYVYCNHSYLDILGYFPDDMIGRNCFDIVHPEDKEKAIQIFQKCLAEKTEEAHLTVRLLCHDGTIKWVDHRARIIVDESSNSMHILLNAMDITENKLADEALRQSKERLDQLAEQSRTIAWEVDTHGLFTYFSHVAENIIGYTPEEVIGKLHFYDLHPEAGREEFKMAALAIFERKDPFLNLINALQTKDGRQLWVSTNGIPMINADGTLRGYRGSDIDITERRQTDISLLESNELNRSMLQTIPFGMDIVDEEGNILFLNETFEKIIGSDAVGKKCWSMYRDDKSQCAGCPLHKGIDIGLTDVYETDGVLGGRIFQISHTGMLFHGRKAMLEIFQDITERVKSRQELISAKEHAEESDRLKTAFLNNISHEIRTPFNCILGFLAILDDDTLSRDERNEYTGMINQAAERLMNAINDIVEMSKIQTGQVKVTLVETDINKLAREVSERFELQARIKNLTFTVKNSLAASACSIKTDDDKLNSVLGILINNAIKFTKAGSIELTVQKNENGLEFSVKDTGTGIPEDKRYRIFKQFMQADVSNTRKFEGSGLGLSIAKAYVEMLGGSIDFESKVDKGSTFYFTIPDANTDAKAHDIPETPAEMEPVRLFSKILVTEDDEVNFEYIKTVLTRAGYEVLYARTGAEAVEICRNNMDIGTIFMDIKMPVMDGYIATREIRKFNPSIPIIAITAYAETGDRKKCLDAGMNDFASKPVTPRDMMEVLDKWLSRDNSR